MASGQSMRGIAAGLGRSHTTISREVLRNGGRVDYRAGVADLAGWERARRPKAAKLTANAALRGEVERCLGLKWSPQQISGWLGRSYAGVEAM